LRLSLIAAVARNGTIGRQNSLPWHLRSDLRRFKRLTMGHVLLLGNSTYRAIGRPLPGRRMAVLSRSPMAPVEATAAHGGVRFYPDVDSALAAVASEPEVFVAGGAEVYRQLLPRVDRLLVTWIEAEVAGDAVMPAVDWRQWSMVAETRLPAGPGDDYPTSFRVYLRAQD
jgi:dihydrofolate reductase